VQTARGPTPGDCVCDPPPRYLQVECVPTAVPTTRGPTSTRNPITQGPTTARPTPVQTSSPSLTATKEPTEKPTKEPTEKPTKEPTSDCRGTGADAYIDQNTRFLEYLYDDECTNKFEQTYSYGQFDDGYDTLTECADDCAREIDSDDLVGVEFTCAGEDEGVCRCLITGGETKAANIRDHKDFDKIYTHGDATIPPEDPEMTRLFVQEDRILCGRIYPHEDVPAWAKASVSASSLQVDAATATVTKVPEILVNPNSASTRFGTVGTALALAGAVATFLLGSP
jgi:hypothetical protein